MQLQCLLALSNEMKFFVNSKSIIITIIDWLRFAVVYEENQIIKPIIHFYKI